MSSSNIKVLLVLAVIASAALAVPALAQESGLVFINSKDVKWGEAPPFLPKSAKIAVLNGDPGKPAPYTLRLMLPAGYKIPPHWHTLDENLTIISGNFRLGLADTVDASKEHALAAGGYHFLPGKAHHYAIAKSATVVQVSGMGPFDINYLDPKDDPRNK